MRELLASRPGAKPLCGVEAEVGGGAKRCGGTLT